MDTPTGLRNTGNTCFVNAALQVLFCSDLLIHRVRHHRKTCPTGNLVTDCIACAIYEDYEAKKRSRTVTIPKCTLAHLGRLIPGMVENSQQDSHAFLLSLLNEVNETCNSSQLDKGIQVWHTQCTTCKFTVEGVPSCLLNISVPVRSTLDEALHEYFGQENVSSDGMTCSACGGREFTRFVELQTTPEILIIQLSRFQYSQSKGRYTRDRAEIAILEHLDLSVFRKPQSPSRVEDKMRCTGLVLHHGATPASGHYTAIARTGPEEWHLFDDSEVKPVSSLLDGERDVYFAVYERYTQTVDQCILPHIRQTERFRAHPGLFADSCPSPSAPSASTAYCSVSTRPGTAVVSRVPPLPSPSPVSVRGDTASREQLVPSQNWAKCSQKTYIRPRVTKTKNYSKTSSSSSSSTVPAPANRGYSVSRPHGRTFSTPPVVTMPIPSSSDSTGPTSSSREGRADSTSLLLEQHRRFDTSDRAQAAGLPIAHSTPTPMLCDERRGGLTIPSDIYDLLHGRPLNKLRAFLDQPLSPVRVRLFPRLRASPEAAKESLLVASPRSSRSSPGGACGVPRYPGAEWNSEESDSDELILSLPSSRWEYLPHPAPPPLCCRMCGFRLRSERHLLRHHLAHSHRLLPDNRALGCRHCGDEFSSSRTLHRHLRVHLTADRQEYRLSALTREFGAVHGQNFSSFGDLVKKCREIEEMQNVEECTGRSLIHTCSICGTTAENCKSLRRHKMAFGENPRKRTDCSDCKRKRTRLLKKIDQKTRLRFWNEVKQNFSVAWI